MTDLQQLRFEISTTQEWHDILADVDSAQVSMGQFNEPLETALFDLTLGAWQHERARRGVLAVLDYLINAGSSMARWTPVSDPPKKADYYLVTVSDALEHGDDFVTEAMFLPPEKWERSGESLDVLAWMPLPEPYKPD